MVGKLEREIIHTVHLALWDGSDVLLIVLTDCFAGIVLTL